MEGGKRGRMMWGKKAEVYLGVRTEKCTVYLEQDREKVSGVSRGKISAQAHHIKLMSASTSLAHSILCEII